MTGPFDEWLDAHDDSDQLAADRRRRWALAGLGALLAVGLGFLFLYVLTTYPEAIAGFVHDMTGGSS